MRFAWPYALALLAVAPTLAVGYWFWLRRKRKYAVQYASLSLIREAMPSASTWRRLLPFVAILLSLTSLAIGAARPHAVRDVGQNNTSIILALDISRSMCAVDVEPNRLAVAQGAARAFIAEQVGGAQIGIVAFAGTARLVVPPTGDTQVLLDAVENFRTAFGTALGSAQLKALDAIAEVNPDVAPAGEPVEPSLSGQSVEFASDIIVLLTDGANSRGPDPLEAAQAAADRRVRVYTIGFGTDQPTEMICGGTQIGADAFGNGEFGSDGYGGDSFGGITGSFGGGGGRGGKINGTPPRVLVIDEPTLSAIAEITGGAYFRAKDADQLVDVFLDLPTDIQMQQEEVEISVWFSTAGLALLLTALGASLRFNRW
jgi:Ca-activated chloride channel family protein